jgi:hypothetical protein
VSLLRKIVGIDIGIEIENNCKTGTFDPHPDFDFEIDNDVRKVQKALVKRSPDAEG